MENLPTTQNQNSSIDFRSPEVIKVLKATVAAGLNDAEFCMFVEHCKGTRLNPFKREVWAIKGKSYTNKRGEKIEGKVQIMTGINGFHTIANDKPEYDGMEVGLIDPNGDFKSQAYPKNDFIGAWAKVYRKDRRIPTEAVAMLREYDKSIGDSYYPDKGIWKTMPRTMIQKCAESVALRKAFPQELNSMYTQEEMPTEYSATAVVEVVDKATGEVHEVRTTAPTTAVEAVATRPEHVPQENRGPIDFSQFKYRYHLPTKKNDPVTGEPVDMQAVRDALKNRGFKFHTENKHWYGNDRIEKLAQYLRPFEPEGIDGDAPIYSDPTLSAPLPFEDELPDWNAKLLAEEAEENQRQALANQ